LIGWREAAKKVRDNNLWTTALALALLVVSGCSFSVESPEKLAFSDVRLGPDLADGTGAGGEVRADVVPALDSGRPEPDLGADLAGEVAADAVVEETCGRDEDCADEFDCTVDWCHDGHCKHTPNAGECPGGDPCKTWTCEPTLGCVPDIASGASCELDDKCVLTAFCNEDGECIGDQLMECPDDQCKQQGACNLATGECDYQVLHDKACDDSNPCTVDDQCVEGDCLGDFEPQVCPCEDTGDCAAFEDGLLCNGILICLDQQCHVDAASVVDCEAALPGSCLVRWCDESTGECLEENLAAGVPCQDGNDCTILDECDGGGACLGETASDLTPCDLDDDLCTLDACQDGQCLAGQPVSCDQTLPPCFVPECQPDTGDCQSIMAPDGTSCANEPDCDCDVAGTCVNGETCHDGLCLGGVNVCADCSLLSDAGHPCDDEDPTTTGDFCFEKKCTGFVSGLWTDAGADQTGLNAVTSLEEHYHALGLKVKTGTQQNTPLFVKFDEGADVVLTTSYPSPSLTALDGRVAIGEPDRLFYLGESWTGNNKLEAALQNACGDLAVKYVLSAVSHRTYVTTGTVPDNQALTEIAAIGFKSKTVISVGNCFMALCGRTPAGEWVCSALSFADVVTGDGNPGTKPKVVSIWLPTSSVECATPSLSCFDQTMPLSVAFETNVFQGRRLYVTQGYVAGDGTPGWNHALTTVGGDSDGYPTRIIDIRADDEGNLMAVGTNGFLFARPQGEEGHLVSPFLSLGMQTAHYFGVYRSSTTTLLAANLVSEQEDESGVLQTLIKSGVVAGSGGLLFDPAGGEQPYFNQLTAIPVCLDCYDSPVGPWGTAGLAVRGDHQPKGSLPDELSGFQLALVGIAPHPDSGAATGALALLTP